MNISPSALDTLTKTIWGEARGEGREGMIAVAWVILNRASIGGWWGNSIETVCLKPWQFSCWNANDPNAPYMRGRKAIPGHQYTAAREAAPWPAFLEHQQRWSRASGHGHVRTRQ